MSASERRERIVDEAEAASWIRDGMCIALGEPAPMAMLRHIVRTGAKDLTVVASGLALDLLVAAGCVRKAITYYAGGGFGVPVAPSFRRAAESGNLEVWECEEGILTQGLQAAAQGLPFLPWRGGIGTSLPEINSDLVTMKDPIRGEPLIAVPAIRPDLAILHAAVADPYGNVQHEGGPGWLDLFLCRAATRSLIQVEKVIANEQVRGDPWATTIAGADAIVRMPYGAHPFYSRGYYVQDSPFLRDYVAAATEATRSEERTGLDHFLERYCREPETHADYLERVGIKRLLALYEY